jgi:hypothetical protein
VPRVSFAHPLKYLLLSLPILLVAWLLTQDKGEPTFPGALIVQSFTEFQAVGELNAEVIGWSTLLTIQERSSGSLWKLDCLSILDTQSNDEDDEIVLPGILDDDDVNTEGMTIQGL